VELLVFLCKSKVKLNAVRLIRVLLSHVLCSVGDTDNKVLFGVIILSVGVVRVGVFFFDFVGAAISDQILEINMSVIDFEFLDND
jgi:hypothetical protein